MGNSIRSGLANKVVSSRLFGNIHKYALQGGQHGTLPEALLPGYSVIANDIMALGTYRVVYWMPKVNATNIAKFQSWAKKNIQSLSGSNVTSTLKTINSTLNTYGFYYKPDSSSKAKVVLPIPQAIPR